MWTGNKRQMMIGPSRHIETKGAIKICRGVHQTETITLLDMLASGFTTLLCRSAKIARPVLTNESSPQ